MLLSADEDDVDQRIIGEPPSSKMRSEEGGCAHPEAFGLEDIRRIQTIDPHEVRRLRGIIVIRDLEARARPFLIPYARISSGRGTVHEEVSRSAYEHFLSSDCLTRKVKFVPSSFAGPSPG